jgi:hypothetical protein
VLAPFVLAFTIATVGIDVDFSATATIAAILVLAVALLDLSFAFAGDPTNGECEESCKDPPRQPSALFIASHWILP